MDDSMEEHRKAVALFRFEVLAPVLNEPPERTASLIRVQAAKVWDIPGSNRMRVAEGTIYDWLRLYRARGFDGLLPKSRRDRAKPRRMPPDAVDAVRSIKGKAPELSIRQVIGKARETNAVPEDVPLPPSTLHRLFTREGLMVREQLGPAEGPAALGVPVCRRSLAVGRDARTCGARRARAHAEDLSARSPGRRDPGCPSRRVPVLGERIRVPAGVPGGGAAQGHPPAPLCGQRGVLPFESFGHDLRQTGRRFDPCTRVSPGWKGQDRTSFSDHTVPVHAPGGRCGDAQPGVAEPDVLELAGRRVPPSPTSRARHPLPAGQVGTVR